MSLEVERTFALADDEELPPLAGLGEAVVFALEATYYDTIHFRLVRSRRVVRHRVGGDDDGWHVKLPGTDAEHRVEHHALASAARLPQQLRSLVAAELAGEALVPAATLRTRRRQAQLTSADGTVLALVCEDDVVADARGHHQTWREAEVELVHGSPQLLEELTRRFAAAAILPAAGQSKIVRALGPALEAEERAAAEPTAAAMVLDYLSGQLGTLQALESDVLAGAPDAVHRSRVATRRMRSALRTFAPLFGGGVRQMRAELAWYAAELGAPRDAEVLRDSLLVALDHLDVPEDAPERALIADSLAAGQRRAHAELVRTMATARYDDLQGRLADWLADPPLAPVDDAWPAAVLHGLLDRAHGRVTRRYAEALRDPAELTGWHEVRKAAKAVRYCAEALTPAFGDRATAHAARWEAVTDALGQLQDSLVARAAIAGLGTESAVLSAVVTYEMGRGQAELARGRAALEAALAASL